MMGIIQNFRKLIKAEAINDPYALAEYVSERYGTMKPSAMARGIAGKMNAKKWNPVSRASDPKSRSNYGAEKMGEGKRGKRKERKTQMVPKGWRASKGTKALERRGPIKRRLPGFGGPELKKAQTIRDARKLAGHLQGIPDSRHPDSGERTLWHGSKAGSKVGDRPWKDYEGGIRSKDNAKEWNPMVHPEEYDETGMHLRRDDKGQLITADQAKKDKEQKRQEAQRVKRVEAAKRGAAEHRRKEEAGVAGRQYRLPGEDWGQYKEPTKEASKMEKAIHILKGGAVPKKFGGKPLKWEDLPRDPMAFSTNVLNQKGFWYANLGAKSKGSKLRNKLARDIRELIRDVPDATRKEQKQGKIQDQKDIKEYAKVSDQMKDSWENGETDMKKQVVSPALLSLLGFGAGWAMSDTFTEAPRGRMTPSQQRDWERLVRTSMRRKKNLSKEDINSLQTYYKDMSDTYVKKIPIDNSLNIVKDHAPIPPRQGLVWDEQKKHWTRPEHVGHSVSEVQGKKRIRGTGTGVHEHSLAVGQIGGKGAGSAVGGRRFRGAADVGIATPHEAKHPSTTHLASTKPAKQAVQRFLASKKKKAAS